MTADVTLEQHRQLVKERSRGAWLTHERSLRLREVVYASITFLSLAIALGSVFLAHQYGMSVVVHQNVRDVDRYGQVVAESGSVYRIPAGLAPHALISQFITDVYTVYASGPALQRNYSEAQSLVDSRSDVLPRLKDFWSSYSPLRTDLSWDRSRDTERTVTMTSILDRGKWNDDRSAEEYEVEWTVTSIGADGHQARPQLYHGDIALESGADRTDNNPFGLLVTHFSSGVQQ